MYEKIIATTEFILKKIEKKPEIAIVLGSGLGNLANLIEVSTIIEYKDIPNFPASTVAGHKGRLVFGQLGGKFVMAMQGRFHFYEGYDMKMVTFPMRVMQFLGVKTMILSNAAGGMNPNFKVADIMIIKDHINFFPSNPLLGPNDDRLGPRFPDMSEVYSKEYIEQAKNIAKKFDINVKEGVYMGVSGPCFETPSEYRMFWRMGADAVGMSTVTEAIVARHGGMKCFAVSVITDLGIEGMVEKVSHEEVLNAANKAEGNLSRLIVEFVRQLEVE
jgi:purine-nucleoside phosphorylase